MEQSGVLALLNNIALLLVISVAYEVTYLLPKKFDRIQPVINGVLLSFICIAIMSMPFTLQPGIFYDTRSVLISVAALVFGTVPTLIVTLAATILRVSIGGAGAVPGVAVILSSALIGLFWRHWVNPKIQKRRWLSILFMSLIVHAVMLACMLLLPYPESLEVIRQIALPVMVMYPIASVLLGLLLIRQQAYKTIQFQLKLSEERFKTLFEQAPLAYQLLDQDGKIVEVNHQWLTMLGYSRDEVIGRWFGDFTVDAEREVFCNLFYAFLKQGFMQAEFTLNSKSGEPISIRFEGKAEPFEPEGYSRFLCILQDITQQKATEQELRVSEEKHRRLFETTALGVVYQAADGSIISANPAAERILGHTFEEIIGETSLSPFWEIIKEDGSAANGNDHPSMIALRTGKSCGPVIFGVKNPQKAEYVWISIFAIPLYQPGETKPYQVYTTFQDISAERKASRNYYLLFHEMVDAFALHEIICDDSGKPVNYRFLAVNSAFEEMTGVKAEEITGKTVLEVFPQTEQYWIDTYGKVALTGEPIRFENFNISTNKHFTVNAYQPAPNQFACTFSDVTMRIRAEEESKRIMARLRGLLENSPSLIVIVDERGNLIEASLAAEKMMGLKGATSSIETVSKPAPDQILRKVKLALMHKPGDEQVIESIDVYSTGSGERFFESLLFPVRVPSHDVRLFGYLAIDVTARIEAERALKESEAKYSSYIENSPYGVFVVGEDGRYVEVNRSATSLTGYSREQLLKMTILSITAPESKEDTICLFEELQQVGHMSAELRYIHQSGETRWWTVNAVKLSQSRYLGFSIDITEQKNAEAELIQIGNHDFLTGLFNRRYFELELKRIDQPENLPISIIMGDINGVKLVNDAFGHAEGDRLITESAGIIKSCCRVGDILARVGGDEFAMIMPRTDNASALEVLGNIQAALKAFDAVSGKEHFQHSVSLGFGIKRTPAEEIAQTLKIAEEYMYQRKLLEHNSSHSTIISSIKATMFEKSHETEEHAERLVVLSKTVAFGLGLSQIDRDRLELLATLHDIGKVGISDYILTKQGKLTDDEWVEMKRHPEIGYRIAMSSPELIPVAESILCHHERWDGGGYPQGLDGERIPLLSRIISVVDAYDAMTQDRSYRSALTHQEAVIELAKNAGTQFDPDVVRAFLEEYQDGLKMPAHG
ncbi:MAG TPA: PAS domain S-box protein [Candidatus Cryosericum sp.]|nr:PAS domain S-box protein [Candidatus Cryosericum sp.]